MDITIDQNQINEIEDDEEAGKWLTMVESKNGAVWSRIVESKGDG